MAHSVRQAPSAFDIHEAPTLRRRCNSRPDRLSVVDPLVLVVDDEEDARVICCASLQHLGYRTLDREDGVQAIEAAREHMPDVVLLDVNMPRLDGLEATRRLKSDTATRGCFVVIMTACGDARFDEAIRAGCDAFLCKPFNPFVLEEIVGARRPDEDHGVVKRCACGIGYTRAGWKALPLCGTMLRTELRNCTCGSSMALARGDLPALPRR